EQFQVAGSGGQQYHFGRHGTSADGGGRAMVHGILRRVQALAAWLASRVSCGTQEPQTVPQPRRCLSTVRSAPVRSSARIADSLTWRQTHTIGSRGTAAWAEKAASRGPCQGRPASAVARSEEHTSELQSRENLVCRLL